MLWMVLLLAQAIFPFPGGVTSISGGPITADSSCTGTGSTAVSACSSPMTVTAGDTITVECYTNNGSFDPSNIIAGDPVNGYYDEVRGNPHPANSNVWVATFVMTNSAGGSVTPFCQNWENNGFGVAAQAWKGTRPSMVLDGGGVNLFTSASTAAANPTAGTAAAPTNNNEAVVCQMLRPSASATTAGTGYTPSGTLTAVANTYAQYFEYQIQTTATAANCPYTSASAQYTDGQFAILNSANPSGYRSLTGFYGAPAAAQTNGASVTAAILNTNSGALSPLSPAGSSWSIPGGSATFDTSVAPLGSYKLLVNGVPHVIGDAATSIKVASASTTTDIQYAMEGLTNDGTGLWLGSFLRIGTNSAANQFCDIWNADATEVEGNETTQIHTDASNVLYFQFEINQGNTPTGVNLYPSTALSTGKDYYIITHVAGINEPNDEVYVLAEATPGVLPWTVIDHITWPRAGPIQDTTTATASSGATSITVASATGIVVGQTVWSATGSVSTPQITPGTTVTSVSGTTIGISAATTASMSATPVIFTGQKATTTGSVTAGSATLTVASGTGLVAGAHGTGQLVGMAGVLPGTWLLSGSGTSWTMSQPAASTQSSVTATFWPPNTGTLETHFGKYSSCTSTADIWFSGFVYDPWATFLPYIASGSLSL